MDTLDTSRPEIITCSLNKTKWAPLWIVRKNCFFLKCQHWSGHLQGTSAAFQAVLLHSVSTGLDLPEMHTSCRMSFNTSRSIDLNLTLLYLEAFLIMKLFK